MKLVYFIAAIAFSYSGIPFLVKSEGRYYCRLFYLEGKIGKEKILAFLQEKKGHYLFSSELEPNFDKISRTSFALYFSKWSGYRVLSQLRNLAGENDAASERSKFYAVNRWCDRFNNKF